MSFRLWLLWTFPRRAVARVLYWAAVLAITASHWLAVAGQWICSLGVWVYRDE